MAEKNFISGMILEGTRFEGKLCFKDKMRIDGHFQGEIESNDQLVIGKNARVDAKIKVGEMIVMGEVKGQVTHCGLLQIQDGGRVIADIHVVKLDVQQGAIFDGKCTMAVSKEPATAIAGK